MNIACNLDVDLGQQMKGACLALGAWILLIGLRLADSTSSGQMILLHGIYDESGHLLTAFIIVLGLRTFHFPIPMWSVLLGGMILDVGHIFDFLALSEPVHGSSRNGTHSVAALAFFLLMSCYDRNRRYVWLGLLLGAISHLWRDLGTGTVPLFWPFSRQVEEITFARYMVGLLCLTIAMMSCGVLIDVYTVLKRRKLYK